MSNTVGTIKISELKIITKKENEILTWSLTQGDDSKFIIYKGKIYKLFKEENSSVIE